MLYRRSIKRTNTTQHLLPVFSGKQKSVPNLWVPLCIEVEMSVYKGTCPRKGTLVTSLKTITLNNDESQRFQRWKQFLYGYVFSVKLRLRIGGDWHYSLSIENARRGHCGVTIQSSGFPDTPKVLSKQGVSWLFRKGLAKQEFTRILVTFLTVIVHTVFWGRRMLCCFTLDSGRSGTPAVWERGTRTEK